MSQPNQQDLNEPLVQRDYGYQKININAIDGQQQQQQQRTESRILAEQRAAIKEKYGENGVRNVPLPDRAFSMSTRPNKKAQEQIQHALEVCKRPVKLTWKNIEFEVSVLATPEEQAKLGTKMKRLKVVKNAYGYAMPGQSLYIMGASGAGKTSLLNILGDRCPLRNNAFLGGTLLFNDKVPCNQKTFARYAAYVMQDDVLYQYFSVREALTFAARLKLKLPEFEQDKRIDGILKDLGITHIQNSMIGSAEKKVISGGERKRTSIGVEMITDPSVLMLDEPTSGLDSFKATSIVRLLKSLADKRGKTIISTIHAPSSEAFYYFDRLILMADGYTVYQGDAGNTCMDYFKSLNMFEVPNFCNPGDFFLKVLAINYPKQAEDDKKLADLNNFYQERMARQVEAESKHFKLEVPNDRGQDIGPAKTSVQISQLMMRSNVLMKREPRLTRAKITQTVLICLFMMPVFWELSPNPNAQPSYSTVLSDQQNMIGAMYFTATVQVMLNFLPTVIIFQSEKPIYVREKAGDMYSVWTYAFTKWIAEMPILTLLPMITCILIYFSTEYYLSAAEFFKFYLTIFMMVQAATALGYWLSALFDQETSAVAVSPLVNQPLNLMGGYYVNSKTYPTWIGWLQYLSPVRYGFMSLSEAQWQPYSAYNGSVKDWSNVYLFDLGYWESIACMLVIAIMLRLFVVLALWSQHQTCPCCPGGKDDRNKGITFDFAAHEAGQPTGNAM